MFLVSVLKQTTNVLSGPPKNPHAEEEFDNTALRRPAPPSDKSPKAALQKNHMCRDGGISCSLTCGLLTENVTLSFVQAPIPDCG